jgi:hypothetical protein
MASVRGPSSAASDDGTHDQLSSSVPSNPVDRNV